MPVESQWSDLSQKMKQEIRPYFRSFNMIVEIVPEGLDVRDALLPPLGGKVATK